MFGYSNFGYITSLELKQISEIKKNILKNIFFFFGIINFFQMKWKECDWFIYERLGRNQKKIHQFMVKKTKITGIIY